MEELYRGVEDLVGWEEERKVRGEGSGLDGRIISRGRGSSRMRRGEKG